MMLVNEHVGYMGRAHRTDPATLAVALPNVVAHWLIEQRWRKARDLIVVKVLDGYAVIVAHIDTDTAGTLRRLDLPPQWAYDIEVCEPLQVDCDEDAEQVAQRLAQECCDGPLVSGSDVDSRTVWRSLVSGFEHHVNKRRAGTPDSQALPATDPAQVSDPAGGV